MWCRSAGILLCGHPGVSVWCCDAGAVDMHILSHHRAAGVDFASNEAYKISGDFVPNTNYFAATDSLGNMLMLQLT